ncbi:polycystin family receptor for egg jelly-like [Ptychodera flava]|uniref:polycystin family receptor for egg jelly-like n=1 Tax=Ptychodera flava TaxID=63121 RepID=UPI003969F52A
MKLVAVARRRKQLESSAQVATLTTFTGRWTKQRKAYLAPCTRASMRVPTLLKTDNIKAISIKRAPDWVDLGDLPGSCLEDIQNCTSGVFTLSFWFKTGTLDRNQVILEMGNNQSAGGLTFEYVDGHFEVTLRKHEWVWRVYFVANFKEWSKLTFLCGKDNGTKVYVDNMKVSGDTEGQQRDFYEMESGYSFQIGKRNSRDILNRIAEFFIDEMHYLELYSQQLEPINIAHGKETTSVGRTLIQTDVTEATENAVDGILDTFVSLYVEHENGFLRIDFGDLRSVSHAVVYTADLQQEIRISIGKEIENKENCGPYIELNAFTGYIQRCKSSILGRHSFIELRHRGRYKYLRLSEIQLFYDPSYIGCYEGNNSTTDVESNQWFGIGECRQHCALTGFPFAGLTNSGACLCDSSYDGAPRSDRCLGFLKYAPNVFTNSHNNRDVLGNLDNAVSWFMASNVAEELSMNFTVDLRCQSSSNPTEGNFVHNDDQLYTTTEIIACTTSVQVERHSLFLRLQATIQDMKLVADEIISSDVEHTIQVSFASDGEYEVKVVVKNSIMLVSQKLTVRIRVGLKAPLLAMTAPEHTNTSGAGNATINDTFSILDQSAITGKMTFFTGVYIDNISSTCVIAFGDGGVEEEGVNQVQIINYQHKYSNPGTYVTVLECFNDYVAYRLVYTRKVRKRVSNAKIDITQSFSVLTSVPSTVTWNVEEEYEDVELYLVMMNTSTENGHTRATRMLLHAGDWKNLQGLDYYQGNYTANYTCTGLHVLYLLLFNYPQGVIQNVRFYSVAENVSLVDMELFPDYNRTDFRSLTTRKYYEEEMLEIERNTKLKMGVSTQIENGSFRIFTYESDNITSPMEIVLYVDEERRQLEELRTHNYTKKGNFTLGVTAVNDVDISSVTYDIYVYPVCEKPLVWINGYGKYRSMPRKEYRSTAITITGMVTYICKVEDIVSFAQFTWTAYRIQKDEEPEYIPVPQSKRWANTFPGKTFPLGLIKIYLEVKLTTDGDSDIEPGGDSIYILVGRAPPSVTINGGSSRIHSLVNNLVLDASMSANPDSDDQSLDIKWACRRPGSVYEDTGSDFDFGPCNISSEGLKASDGSKILTVSNSSLEKTRYIFRARLQGEDDQYDEFEQEVTVINNASMEFKIRCVLNCGRTIGSSHATSLLVECTNDACYQHEKSVTYQWTLSEYDGVLNAYERVKDDPSDIYKFVGNQGSSVMIFENFLNKGSQYRLQVSVDGITSIDDFVAFYEFQTANSPYNGTCEVTPEEGTAFETYFYVLCEHWLTGIEDEDVNVDENLRPGMHYRIQLTSAGIVYGSDFYFAPDPLTPRMKFPVGPAEFGHVWELQVVIENDFKEFATKMLNVKVSPPPSKVTEGALRLVDSMKHLDNPIQTNQMVMMVASELNKDTGSRTRDGQDIKEARRKLGEALEFSSSLLFTPESVSQTLSVLDLAAKEPSEIDEAGQSSMVTVIARSSTALLNMTADTSLPQVVVEETLGDMVSSSSYLLESLYQSNIEYFMPENTTEDKLETPRTNVSNVAHLTNTVVDSLDKMSAGVLRRILPGEPAVNVSKHGVLLQLEKTTQDKLSNKQIGVKNGTFSLTSAQGMFSDVNSSSVDLKVIQYNTNPFIWDDNSSIGSSVISVELYDDNGIPINQQNNTEEFKFTIPFMREVNSGDAKRVPDLAKLNNTIDIPLHYEFLVTSPGTNIKIFLSTKRTYNTTYAVFISFDMEPTPDNFDVRIVVPKEILFEDSMNTLNSVWDADIENVDAKPQIMRRNQAAYSNIALNAYTHEIFLPADFFNRLGTYFIKVTEFKGMWNISGYPIVERPSHPYVFKIQSFTCKFWNVETERWSDSGCMVDPMSLPEETSCFCNHLTNFGIDSFYVPVNTIPWDELSFSNLEDNPLVISMVCAILVVYFILAVCMNRMDKNDLVRWSRTPLIDNHDGDHISYHMKIYTGFSGDSGTRSNIYFRLVGENMDTGVRQLKDEFGKVFSGGSINNFLMRVPRHLGKLLCLYIWHDSSGLGDDASWFLNRVVITDVQTSEHYSFICNRWLAVDKDDGKVDRVLTVAGQDHLNDFALRFGMRRQKGLTDDHLWFSLFLRPSRSAFTRLQRLSCCLALLFAYFISNAMFYKTDSEAEKTSYTKVRFGPVQFSLQQIYIGTISGLVVVPVNLLIVNIFRQSRRSIDVNKQKKCCGRLCNWLFRWRRMPYAQHIDSKSTLSTEYSDSFLLPWWCIYIAWIGVFLVVTTSAAFVIMYSMAWGKEKSRDWLTSVGTSFAESVLCVEPLKIIAIATVFSLVIRDLGSDGDDNKRRKKYHGDNEDDIIENQFNVVNDHYKDSKYGPLNSEELEKIKDRRTREKKLMAVFYGIIVYSIFIGITLTLSYQVRDQSMYNINKNILNIYVDGLPSFRKITDGKKFWQWMDKIFIPTIYPATSKGVISATSDSHYFRISSPRIRQQRHKKGNCVVQALGEECELLGETEISNFNAGWESYLTDPNKTATPTPWMYSSTSKLHGTFFAGQYGVYATDGYVATLANTLNDSKNIVRSLAGNAWLDIYTKVILVEFNLYIPDGQLFSSVVLGVEFHKSGHTHSRVSHHSFHAPNLFNANAVYDINVLMVFFCWITFGIFAIVQLVSLLRRIRTQRTFFLKIVWNYFDTVLILITFVSLVLFFVCDLHTADALQQIKKGK